MKNIFFKKITSKNKILIFLVLFFALNNTKVLAASLSLELPKNVSIGEKFSVDLLIDPENQSINSIESSIIFPKEILKYNGFSIKQSSIPVWVEEPKEEFLGTIHFAGVIPGGLERLYDPMKGNNHAIPVLRFYFIAIKSGSANFEIKNSLVLKNDGKGSAVYVSENGSSINISGEQTENIQQVDSTPPEPFTVSIIDRSTFGRNPRLAVFSASDLDGAIEHYEVSVGNGTFSIANSPYPLPYKIMGYKLTVRAFDFSGNMREQQIDVPGEKSYGMGILVILFILLIAFIRYKFYVKVK